jgi:hypothetical protein
VTWIKQLKAAVVSKNLVQVSQLLDVVPQLDANEAKEAVYLLEDAVETAIKRRDETALKMSQLQKSREFLTSTQDMKKWRLDITS